MATLPAVPALGHPLKKIPEATAQTIAARERLCFVVATRQESTGSMTLDRSRTKGTFPLLSAGKRLPAPSTTAPEMQRKSTHMSGALSTHMCRIRQSVHREEATTSPKHALQNPGLRWRFGLLLSNFNAEWKCYALRCSILTFARIQAAMTMFGIAWDGNLLTRVAIVL